MDPDENFKKFLRQTYKDIILEKVKNKNLVLEELDEPLKLVELYHDDRKPFRRAQIDTIKMLLKHDFFVKKEQSDVDVKALQEKVSQTMKPLNHFNW